MPRDRSTPTQRRLPKPLQRVSVLGLLWLAACQAPLAQPLDVPSAAAQDAFLKARVGLQSDIGLEAVFEHLAEACALAPEWAAPHRLRDDLRQGFLQGPAVLRERWRARQTEPARRPQAYLMGRMRGGVSGKWFEVASRERPGDPWGWHGLAFAAFGQQRTKLAQRYQKEAMRLAREPFEYGQFCAAQARHLTAAQDWSGAMRLLERAIATSDHPLDRVDLQVQWIAAAKRSGAAESTRQAELLARRILRDPELDVAVLTRLVESRALPREEIGLYLLRRKEPEVWDLALDWAGTSALPLRLALQAEQGGEEAAALAIPRADHFRQGTGSQAVADWMQGLPTFLWTNNNVDMERWQHLLESCQSWESHPDEASAQQVCEALLAVGWHAEALAFARSMPEGLSVAYALDVEARARAARNTLTRLGRLLRKLDRGQALWTEAPSDHVHGEGHAAEGDEFSEHEFADASSDSEQSAFLPPAPPSLPDPAMEVGPAPRSQLDLGRERKVKSLEGLLAAVAQVFVDSGLIPESERDALVDSPRLRVSTFAQVVHPGPVAAPWDAHIVDSDQPIPGLASALLELGRVGIFGAALGVAPDATVLRYIASERIRGEHMGVPYFGTVLWCDGADIGGRAMRGGGSVAGAALHEGYYVDVAELEGSVAIWNQWGARWNGEWRKQQYMAALADPGLPVDFVRAWPRPELADGEVFRPMQNPWYSTDWLLGQADRVRLVELLERAGWGGSEAANLPEHLGSVHLTEMARMTAIHEEGHLLERSRFLPLHKHWTRVLAFAASQNFSPRRIQERFEYRAELVALCVFEKPRLVLVDILDQAQNGSTGMPHAAGYKALLDDLLEVLGEADQAGAAWLQGWRADREHLLAHQLHRIPPEVLRSAGWRLAHKLNLTEGGARQPVSEPADETLAD